MGHCSDQQGLESDGLSRGTLGHPQSPIMEKSDPPGRPGLERVVQSISPVDSLYYSTKCVTFVKQT